MTIESTRALFAVGGAMCVIAGAYMVAGVGGFLIAVGVWTCIAAAYWPKGEIQ